MQEHFGEPCLGDPCLNDDLLYAFGSVQKGMLSLYMATSGGNDWSYYYNMLAQTGEMTAALFIFYTAFNFFGTLNILTGLFVDKATMYVCMCIYIYIYTYIHNNSNNNNNNNNNNDDSYNNTKNSAQ